MPTTHTIRFETDAEFGAFYAMLHFGVVVAAQIHRTRTLLDVEREAVLDDAIVAISLEDFQFTPAGSKMRQLDPDGPKLVEVDGETFVLVDKYIRYAAERSAPDFARTATTALQVVRRAASTP
jgi:hypothetical protein